MFIKKDLRKIPLILAEAAVEDFDRDVLDEDEQPTKRPKRQILRELKLSRRKAEFNGSLNLLCQPKNAPSLFNLVNLSVYDCQIQSLDGIGLFGSPIDGRSVCCPSLEILNVGRNPIDRIPPEMAFLGGALKEFWCDDCNITGPMPECILKLTKLETLQLSNNKIISIPSHIEKLDRLQMLCLDRNEIEEIPSSLAKLVNLTSVLLRQNKIKQLPENVPGPQMTKLTLFHASSNQLTTLPESFSECSSLECVFVNSNHLTSIPLDIPRKLLSLKRINFSNNSIAYLPSPFLDRFGSPDATTGLCDKDPTCIVNVGKNPVYEDMQQKQGQQNVNGSFIADPVMVM